MDKIKVLHVITGLKPGGAEKVVFDLCRMTDRTIFDVQVVSLSKRTELLTKFLDHNIPTLAIKIGKTPLGVFKAIAKINGIIKKQKISILHAHMTHSMIVCGFLKLLNPTIKIVFTSHNFNVGSIVREFILRALKPFRDVDIVFSEEMTNAFYINNKVVLPNGIETKAYDLALPKRKKFTFLTIGRIEFVKNHILLIEAAKKLKNKIDFELLIVGDGVLRSEIEQKIAEYKLQDVVKLLGFRNDIVELCNSAHVFVLPSHWEGMPISMLEAGASGMVVLSTPVGSIPSLINEHTGILASADKFSDAMLRVYEDFDSYRPLGANVKKLVQNEYDLEKIVQKHQEIYLSLI